MNHTNDTPSTGTDPVAVEMRGKRKLIIRILLCAFFIGLGIAVKMIMTAMREAPPPAELPPAILQVEVREVRPEDVPVVISGYGEVRAAGTVALTPKVAGDIVYLHPLLEVGAVIPEGELLYRIDQRDYLAVREQAQAQVERLTVMTTLLRRQYELSQSRLETVRRTRDIASEEFKRDATLYEKEDVGSQSMVNLSEINFQRAQDAFEQVDHALELFPLQIKEAEIGLTAAKASLQLANLNLERTEAYAPFKARIQFKQIEVGQAVAPGVVALMLADDSALEISVPIDSRDAQRWLPFTDSDAPEGANWFRDLEPVECAITWTEDAGAHSWKGNLQRVERFDPMTRTVTVAIRIAEETRRAGGDGLPLVEGMFCHVDIPGIPMRQVYRLPRWAVSFKGVAHVAEGDRLRRREVNVVRTQGEETFVDSGLEPGELAVITRMVDPTPGTLISHSLNQSEEPDQNKDQNQAASEGTNDKQ